MIAGYGLAIWVSFASLASSQTPIASCRADRVDVKISQSSEPDNIQFRSFSVEVADTAAERARGLMFRPEMAPGAGMLFIYEAPQRASFWMKNTLIPLDIIFADARGEVLRVHANAQPHDLTPIDGGEGVRYVLEINGGLAAALGIAPGAQLRHPGLGNSAAWACGQ